MIFKWRTSGANRFLDFRLQRNSSDIYTGILFNGNVSSRPFDSGFIPVDSISGVQTFTLDFKVSGSGTTVYMSEAYMEIWRIS
jgi:hypothetical protein